MIERIAAALQLHKLDLPALVDILLLALVTYQLLRLIRGTRSVNVMIALGVLVVLHLLTGPGALALNAMHTVLGVLLIVLGAPVGAAGISPVLRERVGAACELYEAGAASLLVVCGGGPPGRV